MFHHDKKLCYIVYPKSGSTSMRDYLLKKGFVYTFGQEHQTFKEIDDKNRERNNRLNLNKYTFFSTYLLPEKHFKSNFKHIKYGWGNKIIKNSHWKNQKEHKIENVDDLLDYLEKENLIDYRNWFNDNRGKNRVSIMVEIGLKSESIKNFCQKFDIKYTKFPWLRPSNKDDPNKPDIEVDIIDTQRHRINEIYDYNISFNERYKL